MEVKHILVTGSEGAIGRRVCPYLVEQGYHVRGFDKQAESSLEDFVSADLSNAAAIETAAEGMDCFIHLGAFSHQNCEFAPTLLEANVHGLYNACEAARKAEVKRLILASSIQVIGNHFCTDEMIGLEHGTAPVNHYAMTKVWAEVAGEMYARHHGLSVVAVRIGAYARGREAYDNWRDKKWMRLMFISHDDANRFFEMASISDSPGAGQYAVTFLISGSNDGHKYDMSPAKDICGFEPANKHPQGMDFPVD